MIIPASTKFDVPDANDPAIQADIVTTLARHAGLVREVPDLLAHLAGGATGGAAMATLTGMALQCYYPTSVIRSLALKRRPPPYPEWPPARGWRPSRRSTRSERGRRLTPRLCSGRHHKRKRPHAREHNATRSDFGLLGYDYDHRFRAFKNALEIMHLVWNGEPVRAAANPKDQAVVRHRLKRLHPMGELDRIAQRELQHGNPELDPMRHSRERRQHLERI
jgi:hypothetical protein